MPLLDEQIERYSRQIILPEIGPEGQARLLGSAVGVIGDGRAAERIVAYLAAAGVGRIAAAESLHRFVDPDQTDVTVVDAPTPATEAALDAVVLCGDRAARAARSWSATPHVLWVANGGAAAIPPCVECAADAARLSPPTASGVLADLRESVMGTIVATEVVKSLLQIGVSLRGRVLLYDPDHAVIESRPVVRRSSCGTCATAS